MFLSFRFWSFKLFKIFGEDRVWFIFWLGYVVVDCFLEFVGFFCLFCLIVVNMRWDNGVGVGSGVEIKGCGEVDFLFKLYNIV